MTIAFQVRFSRRRRAESASRSITQPDDRIFVWGPSPDFYLDAHRGLLHGIRRTFPAHGIHLWKSPERGPDLRSLSADPSGAWEQLERELEHTRPKVLVDEFTALGGASTPSRATRTCGISLQ